MSERNENILFRFILPPFVLILIIVLAFLVSEHSKQLNTESHMRYELVSEKLKEPKESIYIELKDDKYIVNGERGEYIVVFNDDYSKIKHFVKVGSKNND